MKTKNIRIFAEERGLPYSHARDLACGFFKRYRGWCSGHKSAAAQRRRFLTVLIHPRSGQREVLGQTVTGFAERHGLSKQNVYNLINGHKIAYKGWMLEATHQLAQAGTPALDF